MRAGAADAQRLRLATSAAMRASLGLKPLNVGNGQPIRRNGLAAGLRSKLRFRTFESAISKRRAAEGNLLL